MPLSHAACLRLEAHLRYVGIAMGVTAILMVSGPVQAQDFTPPPLPPEAFEVCTGLSENASCEVETHRGLLNGQCLPAGPDALACLPAAPRARGQADAGCCGPQRGHRLLQSQGGLKLLAADQQPVAQPDFNSVVYQDWRIIRSNGIADHDTGRFPNRGNPNAIEEQDISVRVPAFPVLTTAITPVKEFGWAVNGIPFDPGTAETYAGSRDPRWRYEAMSGAIDLGLDQNHAHVQPGGRYHYHGLPTGLLRALDATSEAHSPVVGWAADGFPIYALYGFEDTLNQGSAVIEVTSSYQLKDGQRPGGPDAPSGYYDGTFTGDYEYVAGSGTLDQCNGRFTVTPEYPQGTYAYFLTKSWPVVPRCVRGQLEARTAQLEHQTAGRQMRRNDTKQHFHPHRH